MARLLGIEAAERFTVGKLVQQLKTARWTVDMTGLSDTDCRNVDTWLDRVNTAMEGRNRILHSSEIWETSDDGAEVRSRVGHRDRTVRPEDIRR